MGSPISPELANLAMQDFAEKALDSALTKPHIWYSIQEFTEHINSQSKHIKFTIEAEQNGQIPFLDTMVILNDDGTQKTTSTTNLHTLTNT